MVTRRAWCALLFLLVAVPVFAGSYGGGSYSGGGGAGASPGMALPDTIYTAVDRELNIWNGQLAHVPYLNYPFYYSVVASEGQAENRSYRWTPSAEATVTATVRAYDYGASLAEQSSVIVSAISKTAGTGTKELLFIGDSLFDGTGAGIAAEVDSLFGLDGGGNTVCIGTQVDDGIYHEGRGGWTWERFSTDYAGNPFWDTGRIDFQAYSTNDLGGLEPDYVIISLGGNEALGACQAGNTLDTAAVVTQATAFLDTLFSSTYGYPDCRVIINIMPTACGLPSAFGAAGNYAAEWDPALWFKNIRLLTRAYLTAFDGCAYSDQVDVCASGLWVDPDYGYPRSETGTDISARNTTELPVGTNFLHPTTTGNYQLADALYSHLRHFHQLDEPTNCTNELIDSHSFTNATYWTDVSTYWTAATGQSDPWGGTLATKFTGTASVGAISIKEVDRWQQGGDITFSAFIKNGNLGTADVSNVELINETDSVTYWTRVTWATTPVFAKSGLCGDGGLIFLGDGWYQIWGTLDNTSDAADDMYLRTTPCTTPVQNDEFYIVGGQVEFGVTEPCGLYVETP